MGQTTTALHRESPPRPATLPSAPASLPPLRLAEPSTPKPDTAELGATGYGYSVGSGTTGSKALAKRLRNLEENYKLYERNGYKLYDRMRFSDPKVAGLLRAMRLPILGAQRRVEPADPEDERAKEIADFVADNLFAGLTDSWRDTLCQFLLYLCHGHAPFEIVWKMQDGKARIERFAYRPPSTIATSDIYLVGGRIDHIHQVTETGESCDIPGEKLLWFCNEREGDNWRGTSLLRPMFKPWFAAERLEVLALIAADRMNGVPVATAPEGGWATDSTGADISAKVDAALAAFCQSENGYFNLPPGASFQLHASNASIGDLIALKQSHQQDMSNVAIAQVLDLGKTETGSRALGNTMSDMFADSLSAIAADIEDTLNAKGGPIEQLVAYNFAGADGLIPRFRFGAISRLDLKTFAAGLYQCWQMGMPFGAETWEWIRKELDLPAHKAEDEVAAPAPPKDGPGSGAPGTNPASADTSQPQAENEPGPVTACEHEHVHLADGAYWRPPTRLETFVDLADIGARMDAAPAELRTKTQTTRNALTAELIKRVQAAVATGDVAKVAALAQAKAPMVDKLTAEIRALYADAFAAGKAQVASELARQKAGTPVVAQIMEDRQGKSIAAAERKKPPKAPAASTPPPYLDDVAAYIDEQAAVTARQIANAAVSTAAAEAMRAYVTGLTADALTTAITRASDEAALRAGVTVTQIMVTGRADEALANREQIATAYISAILDDRTCQVCEDDDGTEMSLDEGLSFVGNPDCEGGAACRCVALFEYLEEAA